jgi:SAM-dependent methyltransferase
MDNGSAWDRFWSYDRLASFGTGAGAGNYGTAIAAGWRAFFAELPAGSRVLDLATGNGAIAVIAIEAGDRLQVTGADLADVSPAAFVSQCKHQLDQVRFLANTPAEKLPLDDASIDAVVSQYGVEYSDMDRSVPEAARVLAPGGRLRFAVHAAEGKVAADTGRAIADADYLLDHIQLTDRAAACCQAILAIERGRTGGALAQAAAQAKYAAFREGLKAVADRVRGAADVAMLSSVHRSLTELFEQRRSHDEAELQDRIGKLRTEVADHRERQRALLAAARSGAQMAELADHLQDLGFIAIGRSEQRDDDDLIGHVIEALAPPTVRRSPSPRGREGGRPG